MAEAANTDGPLTMAATELQDCYAVSGELATRTRVCQRTFLDCFAAFRR